MTYFVSPELIMFLELERELRIMTSSTLLDDRAGTVALMADKHLKKGQLGSYLPTCIVDMAHCYPLLRIINVW